MLVARCYRTIQIELWTGQGNHAQLLTVTAAAPKERNASAPDQTWRRLCESFSRRIHYSLTLSMHTTWRRLLLCCGPALDHQPVHAVLEVVKSSAAGSWDYIRGCQCLQGTKTNCWSLTRDLCKGRKLDWSDSLSPSVSCIVGRTAAMHRVAAETFAFIYSEYSS